MAERPRPKLYAVTHDILGDVFWDVFRRGLFDAASRYDVDVEHLRPGKFSPEIQAGMIDAAVAARPDGIIATVPDVGAVDGALRRAVASGIPVICVNAKDPRPTPSASPISSISAATTAMPASSPAATSSRRADDTPPSASTTTCSTTSATTTAGSASSGPMTPPAFRPNACASTAPTWPRRRKRSPPISPPIPKRSVRLPSARQVRKWYSRRKNDHPAENGLKHLTFDVAALQLDGIRSGRILATIDSQQYLQGYLSVEWMWLHLTKGFVPASDIHTGPAIVDRSNLEEAAAGVRAGYR